MRAVGDQISKLDEELRSVDEQLTAAVAGIPNLPDPRTPYGKDDSENVVIRTVGEPTDLRFRAQTALGSGPGAGDHQL